MDVLKGFSWLEVCFYIQSGFVLKTFAFVYNSVQDLSRKFYCRVV